MPFKVAFNFNIKKIHQCTIPKANIDMLDSGTSKYTVYLSKDQFTNQKHRKQAIPKTDQYIVIEIKYCHRYQCREVVLL